MERWERGKGEPEKEWRKERWRRPAVTRSSVMLILFGLSGPDPLAGGGLSEEEEAMLRPDILGRDGEETEREKEVLFFIE